MMIVVYRYYVYRRKGAEWEELDRLEEKRNARKIQLQVSGELLKIINSICSRFLKVKPSFYTTLKLF